MAAKAVEVRPGVSVCPKHPDVERHRVEGHKGRRLGRWYCYKCGDATAHRIKREGLKSQAESNREWHERNPEYTHRYHEKQRADAIGVLGGSCVSCGSSDMRVLEIDHIKPIRRQVDQVRVTSGSYTVRRVLQGETENLQVLCANCHKIKTYEEGWH